MLHNDPGETNYLRVQVREKDPVRDSDVDAMAPVQIPLVWRCPRGTTCTRWETVSIDTTQAAADGRKEFRFTLNIPSTPEGPNSGNRQFQSTRWHAILANGEGRPVHNFDTLDRTGAAGWYTDSGYTNVRIRGRDALQAAYGSVCGTWSPEVRGEKDHFVVAVDATNHGTDPGTVVYDGLANNEWRTVDIDTSALADGPHRLSLRADDTQPNGIGSGLFVIPFNVAPTSAVVETDCNNRLDDDCDGLNDCRDEDCSLDSSCLDPCDDDGLCELGENCDNCPADCPGGTCGNGTCDVAEGENCVSCPSDCNGNQSGRKAQRFCCGDGGGLGPVACSDARCSEDGFICSSAPVAPFCCGNGSCEASEDRLICSIDCGGPPVCGDASCDAGESRCSCAADCGAPSIVETLCANGIDDDCDSQTDCNDADCAEECSSSCVSDKGACSSNGDCCSDNCKKGVCRGD